MTAQVGRRGAELVAGGRPIGVGPQWLARLLAPGGQRILDRIDRALDTGRIDARLPDGSRRTLGGRAPGFVTEVNLKSWRA